MNREDVNCKGINCTKICQHNSPWRAFYVVVGSDVSSFFSFCSQECLDTISLDKKIETRRDDAVVRLPERDASLDSLCDCDYPGCKNARYDGPKTVDPVVPPYFVRKNENKKRPTPENTSLVDATIDFVKEELKGNDSSHDWWHIQRVWNMSRRIAEGEGIKDTMLIEMGAILHDVGDWKYSGDEKLGHKKVEEFLRTQDINPDVVKKILAIVERVGFSNELGDDQKDLPIEIAIVQDADRIDALGGIGIARVFTYGGMKKRVLHDPETPPLENFTREMYKAHVGTTINHFHEKLLKLYNLMKTPTGKNIAAERHMFMTAYLDRFYDEWDGIV